MFGSSNYLIKSKYDDDSNKFAIGKMKNETGEDAIEECHIEVKYVLSLGRRQ